jgi:acetamidase/formamidase
MAAWANPGEVVLFDTPTSTADIKDKDKLEENLAFSPSVEYIGTLHQLAGPLGVYGAVAGDKIAIVSRPCPRATAEPFGRTACDQDPRPCEAASSAGHARAPPFSPPLPLVSSGPRVPPSQTILDIEAEDWGWNHAAPGLGYLSDMVKAEVRSPSSEASPLCMLALHQPD